MSARSRPIRRALVLLVLATSLAGCGAAAGLRTAPGTELIRSELVFGRARPDGSLVSEGEWQAFLDQHVTPRFPDGLSVVDMAGQYRTRAGQTIREPSKVILILHEPAEKHRVSIQEIRETYKKLFDQESVLLITSISRVSF